jgi:hypothetical protein
MAKANPKAGLHGRDKQQASLRDKRGGTYDHAGTSPQRKRRRPDLPEGLTRQPKGPYDKDAGRGGKLVRR